MRPFNEFLESHDPSLSISIHDMPFTAAAAAKAKKIAKTLPSSASKDDVDTEVREALKTTLKKGRATTDIKNALVKNHGFSKSIHGLGD